MIILGLSGMGLMDSLKLRLIEKAFMADAKADIDKIAKITVAGYGVTVLSIVFLIISLTPRFLYTIGFMGPLISITLLFIGIIMSAYSELSLGLKVSQRKYEVEKELPFISIFATLASALGLPLSRTFKEARRISFFKAFNRELNFLEKIKLFYIMSDIDALEFVSKFHPSSALREFYQALVAAERAGGDKYRVLFERSSSLIKMLQDRINRLVERYNTITNLEVMFFVVIPLALITLGALFVGNSGYGLTIVATIIFPSISFFMLYFIVQAAYPEELVEKPPMTVFYGIVTALLGASLFVWMLGSRLLESGYEPYMVLGVLYTVILLGGGLYYRKWYKESDEFIFSMPIVTRQIAEECKKGKTPRQAILTLTQYKLPRRVESFVRVLVARISMGLPIRDAIRGIKMPWLTRIYFEFLDMAERYGADPKTLDMLATFTSDTVSVAKIIKDRSLSFKLSSLISIVALVFGFVIVSEKVLTQFAEMGEKFISSSYGASMISLPIHPLTPDMLPVIRNLSYIGIIINTLFISLLSGKTIKGSMSAGLLLGSVLVLIALASIKVLSIIF
jgi:archaellum biogenesis protein FlaJ (TadC family)